MPSEFQPDKNNSVYYVYVQYFKSKAFLYYLYMVIRIKVNNNIYAKMNGNDNKQRKKNEVETPAFGINATDLQLFNNV